MERITYSVIVCQTKMRTFKSLEDFYTSREWTNFRHQLILERLNEKGETIDEHTGRVIVNRKDVILHHIKPITPFNVNDYSISLNPQNIMIVSQRSHNEIHCRFGSRNNKKVYVVYGPPCSGKTTHVERAAGPNDLIIDIDSIWQCISNNPRYTKPDALKRNVFNIRDALLDQVKTRFGSWETAYIVGAYPLIAERQRLQTALGCEFIFIDKTKEECLSNLSKAADRDVKTWEGFINEWFEKFQPE